MLQTQVNYWQLQETKQHNRATEEQAINELYETNRHNLATEKQQARQATAALRQAAAAAKNADTNLFIAQYNKDLGYKNLAVNQRNAESNAKQAQAALKNAESNALQASAAWKNALTNAFAAQSNARYQQGMLKVSKMNTLIANDRNKWERNAQSISNQVERARINQVNSQAALNWAKTRESGTQSQLNLSNIKSNAILNNLRQAQTEYQNKENEYYYSHFLNESMNSTSKFIDALLPF